MTIKIKTTLCFIGAAGLMGAVPGAAEAVCGTFITANTTLTSNHVCGGNGPEIVASGITLDCAGFSISGSGSGVGIRLNNVTQVTVVNCRVSNFGIGYRIQSGGQNRLFGNGAMNNQSASGGFNIANGSTGNVLEGNFSAHNAGRGFSVNASDQNTLRFNEAFDNGFRGFDIINSDFNHLHGNAAFNNTSAGIVVQDYLGGTSTGNVLEQNQIDSSGSEGLAMFASGNTVVSLISNNNGTWGIRDVSGGANTYGGNSCTGNGSGPSSPASLC